MKKFIFFLSAIAFAAIAGSCDSADSISEGKILNLVEKQLKESGKAGSYVTLQTGYYQLDKDKDRYQLRQLAANDVITYEVERYTVQERYVKSQYYSWGYGWVNDYGYRNKKHYFVKVELTKKGKKLLIDPEDYAPQHNADKYESFVDDTEYPEASVSSEEIFPEDMPQTAPQRELTETELAEADEEEEVETATPEAQPAAQDPNLTPYEKARKAEHSETVYLAAYKVRPVKARNIYLREGYASAEVIMETYDVTPFGRVLADASRNYHTAPQTSFIYYQDKGWSINDNDNPYGNFFKNLFN